MSLMRAVSLGVADKPSLLHILVTKNGIYPFFPRHPNARTRPCSAGSLRARALLDWHRAKETSPISGALAAASHAPPVPRLVQVVKR